MPRRALGDQPFQRAIGIGPSESRGAGYGVPGTGAIRQKNLIYPAFGGSKAEWCEIDRRSRHGSSMGYFLRRCKNSEAQFSDFE